jgi:energy-coupling factor transport system permease protein
VLKTLSPHPAALVLIWMSVAAGVQSLLPQLLLPVTAMMLIAALIIRPPRLVNLLKRTRWIFFSLFFIYAFATPGEALWFFFELPSPTREGVIDGLIQIARFVCILVSLSLLLTYLNRDQLMSALYVLFSPLKWLGVSRERVAVRLALTLHYSEILMQENTLEWRASLRQALMPQHTDLMQVSLTLQRFKMLDALLLLIAALLLIGTFK